MPSYNRVMLIGRLTRDPELRYTSTGLAVTTFSIAVDRRSKNAQGEKATDFFRCKAWRQTAEFVNEYVKKGRLVAVDGRIEMNDFTGQDGVKKTFVDIVCDAVETLDTPRDGAGDGGSSGGGGYGAGAPAAPPAEDNGYFPDEEPAAAAPRAQAQNRGGAPARAGNGPAGGQGGGYGGGAPQRGAAPARAAQPQRPAEPTYPDDDFDDSDPFADE